MKVRRADVVIIDHPFSDASGAKVRPVLIVQDDRRNTLLKETIVALISSNILYLATDPTHLLIEVCTPDGIASGQNTNSVVKCGKLFTIHERLVRRQIGILSMALMQKIDDCLKAALGLS